MALDFPASPTTGDRVTLNSVIYEFDGDKWVTIRSLFDRGQFVAGTAAEPGFSVSTDANTGLYAPGADQLAFTTGGVERVEFGTSEVVFNDGGIDYDFRIEGDADVNLVFADASTDRIGIGTSAPSVKVDIEATEPYVTLKNTTEEDTDGGREVRIDFEGEQSGGEASTLARIEVSHDGAADDEKGKVVISTNDGADAAAPTTAVTIDSAQKVTIAGDLETNTINTLIYPDAGPLSNRNLIINGAMQVAQRGTSETSLGEGNSNTYLIDRFAFMESGTPSYQFTYSQDTDVPTGQGFANSLKLLCTTADTSLTDNERLRIRQAFEGQNLQCIKKGTANAETLSLSFWIKSNLTGDVSVVLEDNTNARMISKNATINSADTWEYKTIQFAGDTSGPLDNDNTISIMLEWYFKAGANYTSGTQASNWDSRANTANFASASNIDLGAAVNNYVNITGVQLEVGSKATPFEHENYSVTRAKCKRYFQYIRMARYIPQIFRGSNNNAGSSASYPLPVEMRTNASSTVSVVNIRNFAGLNSTSGTNEAGTMSVSTGILSGTDAEYYSFGVQEISNLANNELQILANYSATTLFELDAEL